MTIPVPDAFTRQPLKETLDEFPLYQELLKEIDKAHVGVEDDGLTLLERREAARSARTPKRNDILRGLGR